MKTALQSTFSRYISRPIAALALSLAAVAPLAHAGRACEETPPKAEDIRAGLALAVKVRDQLDRSDAQVALVARVGQDLSKYGLKHSHIGFVWRDHPEGRWGVIHLLNQCGTANSNLFNEGLGNFFLDGMHSYEALVMVPTAQVQQRLVAEFSGQPATRMSAKMHEPKYNMLAYPFSTAYQNSNQWVLETLMLATADTATQGDTIGLRTAAQARMKAQGFVPTTLNLGPVTRLGARSRANIMFDDHPNDKRFSDRIEVVTVDSMVRFMTARNMVARSWEVR
jgi:hypothetical protein